MNATRPEFDPEYINQLLKVNADRIRELERALLEAGKAMTMLAAALASVDVYLPKDKTLSRASSTRRGDPLGDDQAAPDDVEWAVMNRAAGG